MPTEKKRRWRVTDRDIEVLRLLTRYGLATVEQVRRELFGDSLKAAYRRLQGLGELGLVKGERIFYRGPAIYRVTERGARLADVDLPPPRLDLERVRHTLEILELAWVLRNDEYEEVEAWICERELRRDKMVARREERSGRMRPGKPMGRTPDGVMVLSDGSRIAVELELSFKRKASYKRIFAHYEQRIEEKMLAGVRFYVASRRALERVETIASHHDLYGHIDFRHYRPVFAPHR